MARTALSSSAGCKDLKGRTGGAWTVVGPVGGLDGVRTIWRLRASCCGRTEDLSHRAAMARLRNRAEKCKECARGDGPTKDETLARRAMRASAEEERAARMQRISAARAYRAACVSERTPRGPSEAEFLAGLSPLPGRAPT